MNGKLRKCRSEIPVSLITAIATEPEDILAKFIQPLLRRVYLCSPSTILKSNLKNCRKHLCQSIYIYLRQILRHQKPFKYIYSMYLISRMLIQVKTDSTSGLFYIYLSSTGYGIFIQRTMNLTINTKIQNINIKYSYSVKSKKKSKYDKFKKREYFFFFFGKHLQYFLINTEEEGIKQIASLGLAIKQLFYHSRNFKICKYLT